MTYSEVRPKDKKVFMVGAQHGGCLKSATKVGVVPRSRYFVFFGTLTPTLSRRERGPAGATFQFPLPLGEGQGEGNRATIPSVP